MNDNLIELPKTNLENKPQPENYFSLHNHSKTFKTLVIILGALILLVGAFDLGINVGLHEARYTYSWAKNYSNNFPLPTGRQFVVVPPPASGQFLNAHGVDGDIITISGGSLTIKDTDGAEKTILISSGTTVRHDYQSLQTTDLKTGQEIVVLGDPNDNGQIQAKFIRILDEQN